MQEQELSANILAMLKDSQWHKYVEMLKLGDNYDPNRAARLWDSQGHKKQLPLAEKVSRGRERAVYTAIMDLKRRGNVERRGNHATRGSEVSWEFRLNGEYVPKCQPRSDKGKQKEPLSDSVADSGRQRKTRSDKGRQRKLALAIERLAEPAMIEQEIERIEKAAKATISACCTLRRIVGLKTHQKRMRAKASPDVPLSSSDPLPIAPHPESVLVAPAVLGAVRQE